MLKQSNMPEAKACVSHSKVSMSTINPDANQTFKPDLVLGGNSCKFWLGDGVSRHCT